MTSVYTFTHAIVRTPAPTVVNALRTGAKPPTYEAILAEHRAYVAALEAAGVAVETLPPLDAFPDSLFVEDPAFVLPEGAILLRPGAPSRLGEAAELAPALRRRFERVLELDRGFVDGGDILMLPDEILVGLSGRTDRKGAERFVELVEEFGQRARIVQSPPGVLHLKSASALLDEETVVATAALAAAGLFDGLETLITPVGEEAAANLLRVNDVALVGNSFPRVIELLSARGYEVIPGSVTEIGKVDAGVSCMSLRWNSGK